MNEYLQIFTVLEYYYLVLSFTKFITRFNDLKVVSMSTLAFVWLRRKLLIYRETGIRNFCFCNDLYYRGDNNRRD